MAPIPGPRPYTEQDERDDREQFGRAFDEAALPSTTELVQTFVRAVALIAAIILLPVLCGAAFSTGGG